MIEDLRGGASTRRIMVGMSAHHELTYPRVGVVIVTAAWVRTEDLIVITESLRL
jgi:hypothetical protein